MVENCHFDLFGVAIHKIFHLQLDILRTFDIFRSEDELYIILFTSTIVMLYLSLSTLMVLRMEAYAMLGSKTTSP